MGWTFIGNTIVNRRGGGQSWSSYWATHSPSNLFAFSSNTNQIEIIYDDAAEAPDGYRIYVDNVENQTVAHGVGKATITGLTADVEYEIKLVAYKGTNESTPLSATEKTLEEWYLSGGISSVNAKGAYRPLISASLADSYVNDVSPGINNAAPGTAPTWSNTLGWIFNGIDQYLTTGIIPENDQTWSMVVRFSGYITGDSTIAGLYNASGSEFYIQLHSTNNAVICSSGKPRPIKGIITEGIIIIAGKKFYVNADKASLDFLSPVGNITYDIWVGMVHYSSPANLFAGNVQSLAIYDKILSDAERLAMTYRMLYLNSPENVSLMNKYVENQFGALVCWNMPTFTDSELANGDLSPDTFSPTGLDIDEWLNALDTAGIKYAMLTVKHHDGFMLWPSAQAAPAHDPYTIAQTTWYANNANPDITKLFIDGCRERGIKPCIYFSVWDLTHEARTGTDEVSDSAAYIQMIEDQLTELLTNYGDIYALWLDGWGWHIDYANIPYATIYDFIKGLQHNCLVIVNDQDQDIRSSQIVEYEPHSDMEIPAGNLRLSEQVETIRTDFKWFWASNVDQNADDFMDKATILARIAQVHDRNGTFLIGITPDKSGHLPPAQKTLLESLTT